MRARRVQVFFYGLFMDTDLLRARGLEPVNARWAVVQGMRLCIGRRAALDPDPDSVAYGVLVELTHTDIERLYAEPSVAMYRPEAVMAVPDEGPPASALCFNLPAAPDSEERNPEYAATLRALAARLGFPTRYVEGIS